MKKTLIKKILDEYLKIFPTEQKRLETLQRYLESNDEKTVCDWNNTNGHLTAGGFLYSIKTKRFLVLWHKDLKMFLYPGGHCDDNQNSPLETAMAEVVEETGIRNFKSLSINNNTEIPIDIDTHLIPYNPRVDMPEHYHFDFRFLFLVEDESTVELDKTELSGYKWIDEKELSEDVHFGNILDKLNKLL